jgi:Tfp pilus assembly protein PilO
VIVGVAGAVLLSLLWYFLLWSPQGKKMDAAEERRETAEQTNDELELTLQRLQDLEERRPELEDQLAQLRRAVPDQPQLARFFLSAYDAAGRSGIELKTVTPARPAADTTAVTAAPATTSTTAASGSGDAATTETTVPAGPAAPSAITMSLVVEGGYFQVLDFLNRVDDMPRVVVVDSLDIGPSESEDSTNPTGDLDATITARMFTGAVPSGGTAAEGTTGATTATTTAPTASSNTGTDQ